MTFETTITNRIVHRALVPLLTVFVCVLASCGEGGAPSSSGSENAAATAEPEPEGALVEIDMDEYNILMNSVMPAGRVSLRLSNRGFEEHNLIFVVLETDSVVWETERRLSPGERRTVILDLEAGNYRAVCDFSGHEGRGMLEEFVVEEQNPE